MRIPINKVYRAFPELDDYSDEQCERLMRRVQLQQGQSIGINMIIGISFVGLAFLIFITCKVVIASLEIPVHVANRQEDMILLLGFVTVFGLPAAVCLFLRDYILRKRLTGAINYAIDRVRCLSCKYILIGQSAKEEHVTCPECGARQHLSELGITEADLIPPETGAAPV
ncbi:MAG: hypothetical protein AAGA29_10995 [Planctomycetota bacterium]